jgi:hypothetical protein
MIESTKGPPHFLVHVSNHGVSFWIFFGVTTNTSRMAMRPLHHHSARSRRLRHYYYIILSLYLLAWQSGQPFAIIGVVHGSSSILDNDDEGIEESPVSPLSMMIPEETLRPFGEYPDLLHLGDIQSFHPIVKFPHQCWRQQQDDNDKNQNGIRSMFACAHSDYTVPRPSSAAQLLEKDKFNRKRKYRWPLLPRLRRWWRTFRIPPYDPTKRYVGRYHEDRVGLYETALFGTTTTSNDKATNVPPPVRSTWGLIWHCTSVHPCIVSITTGSSIRSGTIPPMVIMVMLS